MHHLDELAMISTTRYMLLGVTFALQRTILQHGNLPSTQHFIALTVLLVLSDRCASLALASS